MKLVISLLSVILVLIVLGTLFGALSDMFSAYLNDLLTVGLGICPGNLKPQCFLTEVLGFRYAQEACLHATYRLWEKADVARPMSKGEFPPLLSSLKKTFSSLE